MKLTTKSRYGVRAIFDIAYHAGSLPAQIKHISERQSISARYLEQIFQKLKKAGILGSKRGPRGGYFLLKEPKDITVYDIVTCTEGPIELVFCVGEDHDGEPCHPTQCNLKDACVASPMWKEMGDKIADVFRRTTMLDLCVKARARGIESQFDARLTYDI
jgi:Rrf2 family iron-sulfur cluster assembly transcriptional regulator